MGKDLFTLTADPTPLSSNHPFHPSRSDPSTSSKKVLKSHLALVNFSKEPAVSSRARRGSTSVTSGTSGKRGISRNEKIKLERSVSAGFSRRRRGGGIEGAASETKEEEAERVLKSAVGRIGTELWTDDSKNLEGRKPPPTALKSSKAPVPHPGSSYNPTLTSHQNLLSINHTIASEEEVKEAAVKAIKAKMDAGEELRKRKRLEGVEEEVGSGEEGSDHDDNVGEEGEEKKGPSRKKKRGNAKTRKERRKEEEKATEEKKRLKMLRKQIDELVPPKSTDQASGDSKAMVPYAPLPSPPLSKEEKEEEEDPPTDFTFQLTDSLAPSLRQLEPEGNLIKDFEMRNKKVTGLGGLKKGGVKGGQGRGGKDAQRHWKNKEKEVEKPAWRFWHG